MPIAEHKGNGAAPRALLGTNYIPYAQKNVSYQYLVLVCTWYMVCSETERQRDFLFYEEYHSSQFQKYEVPDHTQLVHGDKTTKRLRNTNAQPLRQRAPNHASELHPRPHPLSLLLLYAQLGVLSRCPITLLLQSGCGGDHPAAVPPATGNRRRPLEGRLQPAEDLGRSVAR